MVRSTFIATIVALALGASPAWAQDQPDRSIAPSTVPSQQDRIAADVGTGWNILNISAAGFTPRYSSLTWGYSGSGYIRATGGIGDTDVFWAPVLLPSGAGIGYLDLFARDTNAADSITASLRVYTGFGVVANCAFICPTAPPSLFDVVTVASVGSGGAQYIYSNELAPLHTVNNNTVYGGGGQYTVVINQPVTTGLEFKGVDIWWKRQISPAPGVASFTDVPTGHPFFQVVEALKASGVTSGCSATTFCPDAPVSRAAMAAFLARALGLYYQY
jgi:hypothetical protein